MLIDQGGARIPDAIRTPPSNQRLGEIVRAGPQPASPINESPESQRRDQTGGGWLRHWGKRRVLNHRGGHLIRPRRRPNARIIHVETWSVLENIACILGVAVDSELEAGD